MTNESTIKKDFIKSLNESTENPYDVSKLVGNEELTCSELKIDQLKDLIEDLCKRYVPGFKIDIFEYEVRNKRSFFGLSIESNDLKGSLGLFDAVLESCVLDDFGSFVYANKKTGKLEATINICLSYTHKGGGMNGMELGEFKFEDGEWNLINH